MSINPEKVEVHFSKKSRNSKNLKNLNRFKISRKKSPFHLSIQILSQKLLIYIYLPISLSQTYLKHSHYLSLFYAQFRSPNLTLFLSIFLCLSISHTIDRIPSLSISVYIFLFFLFFQYPLTLTYIN